jgi:hypothetical protein
VHVSPFQEGNLRGEVLIKLEDYVLGDNTS